MKYKWYYIGIMFKEGMRKYICQIDGNFEKNVSSKRNDEFILLKKVRWIDYSKKRKKSFLVKLEDATEKGFTDCFYIKKEYIESIWPLKSSKSRDSDRFSAH